MFTEDEIFTLAGASLYNKIMAQYAESGLGPEEIAAQLADNGFPALTAENGPTVLGNLAREYYGDTLPQSWTNLTREQAAQIKSGQDPFEGWEVPNTPRPNKWLDAGKGFVQGLKSPPYSWLYKGWRAGTWPYRKQRDWRQERADALAQDALARVRSGDSYRNAYAGEVDRLAAQPRSDREILHTDATKGELSELQVNPHDYWDTWAGRGGKATWPLNQKVPTRVGKAADQEHARRLGVAEARHEIARTDSIGLAQLQDAGSRFGAGERTRDQYENRLRGLVGPGMDFAPTSEEEK